MVSAEIFQDDSFSPSISDAPARGLGVTLGDVFVLSAIAVVTMAVGLGLISQFALSPTAAAGMGAAVFFLLVAGHIGLRRTEAALGRRGRKAKQAKGSIGSGASASMPLGAALKTAAGAKEGVSLGVPEGPKTRSHSDDLDKSKWAAAASQSTISRSASGQSEIGQIASGKGGKSPQAHQDEGKSPGSESPLSKSGEPKPLQSKSPDSKPSARSDDRIAAPSRTDLGSVRPRPAPALDGEPTSRAPLGPLPLPFEAEKPAASALDPARTAHPHAELPDASLASPSDTLLETTPATGATGGGSEPDIDALIRRLADDIESGRKADPLETPSKTLPANTSVSDTSASTMAASGMASHPEDPSCTPLLPASVQPPPPPLDIASLGDGRTGSKSTPPTMVQAARELNDQADTAPRTQTPAAKLAAIADALSDEQMDVYLETINGLEDYRAQHYEVSVRLRLADGDVLGNDAFISEARGTGLLPLLEAVKVSSTKRLAVQMIRRGRAGGFFAAIDGEALGDAQFGDDVETIAGGDTDLASRLVLAFSQDDVRNLSNAQRTTLDAIAALGFKFSIEDITDLDMDFEDLVGRGFTFAKLDSDVFLNGLPMGTSRVPPVDICQHLAKSGLTLIVGDVSDEVARAKILGFGAVLGQGQLFGAPRPVRASVLKSSEPRPEGPATV